MTEPDTHVFSVDLRGLVDLLSHHLYSSPRVYVRELMQNAVDATTARRVLDPTAPAAITMTVTDDGLRVDDDGIGLTEPEVHRLLATIGGSSKRDGIEAARGDFLGRFGIGLLAGFVVASRIRVVTRSAREPDAGCVEWLAEDDGTYTVRRLSEDERRTPGTTVHISPRAGMAEWFQPRRVVELAREYGALLPFDVTVVANGDAVTINEAPVWSVDHPHPTARRIALNDHCEKLLGFTPLDVIDLDVPAAGVRGVAYVLPNHAAANQRALSRVYLKGMLLTEATDTLLPDWAFFLRAVVDVTGLRPTASREHLYEDDALTAVREALGESIRDWLTGLAASEPDRLARFIGVHHLGVKALARHDSRLLELMLPWLPFETTNGRTDLVGFAKTHRPVYVTQTVEEFRQVSQIAAAAGLGVVNGGYTYDRELVLSLPSVLPDVTVVPLDGDIVAAGLDPVDPDRAASLRPFLDLARTTLEASSIDVVVREFHPVTVPALYLDDRDAAHERGRAETAAEADDLWSGILESLTSTTARARLVLNDRNPLVRRVAALKDARLAATAVESLYGQALLTAQHPLSTKDAAMLNRSFLTLLTHVTRDGGDAA
ncbi:HSP90 family protein [Stackebrandtia soli]|uniref:HSP90 family protein n=1 Tax=Stackebrandtia soli TaxID=1892856 RepID=UPI0039EC705F